VEKKKEKSSPYLISFTSWEKREKEIRRRPPVLVGGAAGD
jgi:hypothetical protein